MIEVTVSNVLSMCAVFNYPISKIIKKFLVFLLHCISIRVKIQLLSYELYLPEVKIMINIKLQNSSHSQQLLSGVMIFVCFLSRMTESEHESIAKFTYFVKA